MREVVLAALVSRRRLCGSGAGGVAGGYPQAGLGYGALGEYLSLPALTATLLIGFGARWAGACPGTASTTLGGGSAMGIVLVVGIICGIALRDAVFARQAVQTSEPLPNVSNS